jgi:uncharacterized protein (TIGR03435 family)
MVAMKPILQAFAASNCLALIALSFPSVLARAQQPTGAPTLINLPLNFEVSTIKPAAADAEGWKFLFTPDGLKITNLSLMAIVREALGLDPTRIVSAPGVVKAGGNFDIEAKVSPEDVAKFKGPERKQMVISLLEERCGLKYHHEMRELPEYELVVAKGGVKMTSSKVDAANGTWRARPGHIESTGTGMSDLAGILSKQLGRTVRDETGLIGNYDYRLAWMPDDVPQAMTKAGSLEASGGAASVTDALAPSLFTALREQLGLRLQATKGPVDVVVIDELQPPSAN